MIDIFGVLLVILLFSCVYAYFSKKKVGKRVEIEDDGGDGFDESFGQLGFYDQCLVDYQKTLKPEEDFNEIDFQNFMTGRMFK